MQLNYGWMWCIIIAFSYQLNRSVRAILLYGWKFCKERERESEIEHSYCLLYVQWKKMRQLANLQLYVEIIAFGFHNEIVCEIKFKSDQNFRSETFRKLNRRMLWCRKSFRSYKSSSKAHVNCITYTIFIILFTYLLYFLQIYGIIHPICQFLFKHSMWIWKKLFDKFNRPGFFTNFIQRRKKTVWQVCIWLGETFHPFHVILFS